MIEDFVQKKIASLLEQFIEFEKLMIATTEGMTIKKSTIKPKLVEELSQILGMPLEHISGSISSLGLNLPWQRLFMLKESQIQLSIEGVHLRSRLRSGMSESFILKKRGRLVQSLTEKLFNPLDTSHRSSSFINQKLKEYFLSTIVLEVKNICLQIEIELKYKVELILKVDSCVFRKEDKKSNKMHLVLQGVGLYYRAAGNKQVQLISPANLSFERIKTEGGAENRRVSIHNFNIDRILVHMNNYNYGDIARVLLLIQWHNSFLHLPYEVWKIKPFVLSECKPSSKFLYCAHLIRASIVENNFRRQLLLRKRYLTLYSKLITKKDNFVEADKLQMEELQKGMPLWKIAAYRSFAINVTKKKIEIKEKSAQLASPSKDVLNSEQKDNFYRMISTANSQWFRKWFSGEKDERELEQQFLGKIATIESVPNEVESVLNIKVEIITIKINIITNFGTEPFISLIGFHCEFNKKSLLIEKSWQKSIQFRKCKIEFQKYLGHHERYKNMLCESKEKFASESVLGNQAEEDEFEDINYFLEMNYNNDSKVIGINLLPFDLYINHEIIEKLLILLNVETLSKISKVQKIQEAYLLQYDPWLIVEHQKQKVIQLKKKNIELALESPMKRSVEDTFSSSSAQKNQQDQLPQQKEICLKSAANIIVMADLRAFPATEVVLQLGSFAVSIGSNERRLQFKNIVLKGFFLPKLPEEEQNIYRNLIVPQIQTFILIDSFNLAVQIKSHMNFDETFLDVSSIKATLPPLEHAFTLIEMVFLHLPKYRQNRLKQYYRRKQSIGEQFMDACENLNQHINKSMVMSSEKMTGRTIMRQKRTKITNLRFEGFVFFAEFVQLNTKEVHFAIKQIGYDSKVVHSYNEKSIKLVIRNIRQTLKHIQALETHLKKEVIKKGLGNKVEQKDNRKFGNIQIVHVDLEVIIVLKNKKEEPVCLYFEAGNMKFEESEEALSRRFQASVALSYDESNDRRQKSSEKVPFIEESKIQLQQTTKFNLNELQVIIDSLAINVKPSLFRLLSLLMKEYNVDDKSKYVLTNGVINTIRIKVPPKNYYVDYRHNQKCLLSNSFCEMTIFNRKFELEFNQNQEDIPRRKIQCLPISQNNLLINKEVAPNSYLLQSNIRIVNHQDRTLWIKLGDCEIENTPKQLENRNRLNMLAHYQQRPVDLTEEFSINQREWDGYSPNRKKMSPHKESSKSMSIPLKQKQMMHLLIDFQEHKYLQIVDQGNHFTEVPFQDLFQATELVVQNESSEENEYLVLRSEITEVEGIVGSVYTFHIYSPIYITNKTPWTLQYRLSENQSYISGEQQEQKRALRRRSFEMLPMKKISALYSDKIRRLHYNQVQTVQLSLKKYEREFATFGSLIAKIKQSAVKDQFGFIKDRQLITLRNGKNEIQVELCLQFSDNVMKIKLHPQFVFANLTSVPLQFKVKEEDVTYHQIRIPSLRVEEKDKKLKESHQVNAYLNELANLSSQKFKAKDVLKQLFENYEGGLEAFTGDLKQEITKKIVYYSGKEIIKKQMGFLKSTRGYLSDYAGSDIEYIQQKNIKREGLLLQEEAMKFGPQEYLVFKRVIKIEKYFNLVVFLPTVHIINKSQATFYAKSQAELLIKISKQSHNFIVTSHNSVDIQACLEEEEISLSEWVKVDLQDLRTIYYSKDMIQHHGSGYESKQYNFRKKRMKKVPKIFYKVIICGYEWGQKILIEESQYPPISFINNTNHRIKIEETEERFSEELLNRGDMGEYAPRDPYHTPIFRLSVAERYEYKQLKEFGVSQRQTFALDFGIILSIEEYKDKVIINIKEPSEVKLSISTIQRNLLKEFSLIEERGEPALEQVKKQTLSINILTIAILNSWNRQLNCTLVEGISLSHQVKNYKDYYKLQIQRLEGYDYMGIQPQFIFQAKKKDKNRGGQQKISNFIQLNAVINFHKNALIIQKCEAKITESVFCISADLLLAYVKNYYQPCYVFSEVVKYCKTHKEEHKPSSLMQKRFIIESLNWHATSLTLKGRNLSIMETFLNKTYERLIVKFLNWIGDVKPLTFQAFSLNHQQITLRRLINQINFRKKLTSFATLLMDYPLSELKELILLFAGDDQKSVGDRLHSFYKIFKSVQYILSWAMSLNENLRIQVKTYNQRFIESNKDNSNIIEKIRSYEFCEWKYRMGLPDHKLAGRIRRLERYNSRKGILFYDQNKAKIKLALDCYLGNKVFRKIDRVYKINEDHLVSIAAQWIVIYFNQTNEWIVIKPEFFLDCRMVKQALIFSYWQVDKVNQQGSHLNSKQGRVKELYFRGLQQTDFSEQVLKSFKDTIKQNILCCQY